MAFKVPETFRVTARVAPLIQRKFDLSKPQVQMWITDPTVGNQGFFLIPHFKQANACFLVLASFGSGWEHVSVSIPTSARCPTWPEMCYIKSLFWGAEDTVVQFHPPESEYVNNHEFCLHLWKPTGYVIQTPPSELVGIKSKSS